MKRSLGRALTQSRLRLRRFAPWRAVEPRGRRRSDAGEHDRDKCERKQTAAETGRHRGERNVGLREKKRECAALACSSAQDGSYRIGLVHSYDVKSRLGRDPRTLTHVSWLPDGFSHPQRLDLPTGHHLRPIREADVDIDYPAVMGSRERLWAKYGAAWGWPPADMSYEADREDLARHEREIAAQETFNYAVLDEAETALLGCVYIDPPDDDSPPGTDAVVSWWVVDDAVGTDLERALGELVPTWLAETWRFRSVHSRALARRLRGNAARLLAVVRRLDRDLGKDPVEPARDVPRLLAQHRQEGRHERHLHDSASVRIATASSSPNSLLMRSDVRMNAANTVPMISAAATMTRPIAAIPCSTASRVLQSVDVLLADAAHQEDHVVHGEPEDDREGDRRHEGFDRAGRSRPVKSSRGPPG